MKQNHNKKYKEAIQRAFSSYHAHRRADAESALRKAIVLAPDKEEPRVHLANLLSELQRYTEAADVLRPVAKHKTTAKMLPWIEFMAAWMAGDDDAAIQQINILRDAPDLSLERQRLMLECARQTGNLVLALMLADELGKENIGREIRRQRRVMLVLSFTPKFLRRFLLRFVERVLRRIHRWKWVSFWLECACMVDLFNSEWSRKLGEFQRQTRDVYDPHFQREAKLYRSALRQNPQDTLALHGLLRTYYDMGLWQDVLDEMKAYPSFSWPAMEAVCYANLGMDEKAISLYKMMERQSDSAIYPLSRGLLALGQKRWKDAKSCFSVPENNRGTWVLGRFFSAVADEMQKAPDKPIDGQKILDSLAVFPENPISAVQEKVPCWLCGCEEPRQGLWKDTTTGWVRSRCPACSMVSVVPSPSEESIRALYTGPARKDHVLQRLYKEGLEPVLYAPEAECRRLPFFQEITEWGGDFNWSVFEQRLGIEKRMLDIGCSAGKEVQIFANCGWQAEGIDMDDDAVAYGQSRGVSIRVGTIEELESHNGRYHLIVLLDVIEHIPNPAEFLHRCHALLAPGGVLFIKTPCADSLPHVFIGNRWLEASEHLQFFSRVTLRRLVEQVGFTWVSFKQTMEAPTPFLHDEIWQSRLYPRSLYEWMGILQVGDTIMALARKN